MSATKTSPQTRARSRTTERASGGDVSHPTTEGSTTNAAASGGSSNGAQPIKGEANSIYEASAAPSLIQIMDSVDDTLSDDDAAWVIISVLQNMGADGWNLLHDPISHRIMDHRRSLGRRKERLIKHGAREFTPGDGTQPATNHMRKLSLDQLRDWVGHKMVPAYGSERKDAGDFTISDWETRIFMLRDHIRATQETIDLYEPVVYTLKLLKVDTINEALIPDRKRGK